MADKRYYWIKLKTDFFNLNEIDFLLSQKNGCEYIVLYQMLCLNSANNNGELCSKIGEMIIPYNVEKIVRDTKHFDFDTVTVALELFKRLGLIYEETDNVLKIANFAEMVGSETAWAEKKRLYRATHPQLAEDNARTLSDKRKRLDIEIEIEKDIDKEIDIDKINYQQIADMYNEICISFPRLKSLSDARKKAIKARLKTYSIDDIKTVFTKAEASDFLKGKNNRNWSATFDWMITDSNMAKILDGNYDNEKGGNGNVTGRGAEKSGKAFGNFI